ncbi:hypothetical protein SVIOM342S_03165 [Streptomyces violaceorubidus]
MVAVRLASLLLPGRWDLTGSGTHVTDLVGQLVDEDPVPESRFTDVGTLFTPAVDREPVAALADHLDGAACRAGLLRHQRGEAGGVRAA